MRYFERMVIKLTERRIQDFYPGPYGLGYDSARDIWDEIRNHPLFIDAVLDLINLVDDQIERIKQYLPDHPGGFKKAVEKARVDLKQLSDIGVEIARDVGWGDPRDIMIAIQRHPLVMEKLEERDELKKRRDDLMVL